jgi:glycosyltransferase involved in cell wall biosynthesis
MHFILFHYSFGKLAGTERVLYNIMEYITTIPDARITLILAAPVSPLALNLDAFPVNIVYLDEVVKVDGFVNVLAFHLKLYKKMLRFFEQHAAGGKQVCLATNPILAAIAYYAGKKKLGSRLAVVSCEHFALEVAGRLSKVIRKLLYKRVSVVALTKTDQAAIINNYAPKLCVCIPNAIPFELKPYNDQPEKKTILAVGRLTPQKGFDLLIRAFALVTEKYPDWKLNIVGDDYGDRPMLENLISELNLKHVHLLPATDEIRKHYENATFFALSSRFEGLPMVVLEAMGHGLPVVAFNCPTGPAELVNDTNGFLVPNGDLHAFGHAMDRLMGDHELLLQKAQGANVKALFYTKENINKGWASLFQMIQHDTN